MEGNEAVPTVRVIPDEQPTVEQEPQQGSKRNVVIFVIVGLLILAAVIAGVYFLFTSQPETTSRIRDVFIIFMALEFLIVGVALVILLVQLATLINLLQNEIKPILTSTNETVSTLRGTAAFLSDNLVEPVIKLNEYIAGMRKAFDLFRPTKR
ncbi:MAG TPA: hypothetical protein VHO48_02475 [Anaerolineaceae bacterium]|nr:hypothetical protein [Anaerolineaceae bacterium]